MENITKNDALEQPLVSIIVITYNSSKYVLETLESAKAQTYQNIELIVSDDCSIDNTVEICREWIEKNKERFVRTELITAEKNTGIPANCNRGVKASQGDWVKIIAGDDELKINCIENNIKFAHQHKEAQIIHSNSDYFKNDFKIVNFKGSKDINKEPLFTNNITTEEQYQILLRGCYINTPTVFIKRNVIMENGYFDETIPLLEDWPMWLKLSKNGYKFFFLDISTINYRVHDQSACFMNHNNVLILNHTINQIAVYDKYIKNDLNFSQKIIRSFINNNYLFIRELFNNKRNLLTRSILYLTTTPLLNILKILEKKTLKMRK